MRQKSKRQYPAGMFSLYLTSLVSVIQVSEMRVQMVMSHSRACERQTMFTHDILIQSAAESE